MCAAQLVLYAATSGPFAYGPMNDEFYYLECASRLDWGYVDHPPLSIALLARARAALGDSLWSLNLLPALAACAHLVLLALLARELGGGRRAQALAAVAAFSAPVYQAVAGFYSMNAFEPAIWTAAAWLVARISNGAPASNWLALGAVLGMGLLNKISVLWLGFGLALGLALTPARRLLATRGPWLAGAIALALFAPHLVWQQLHGWPTLDFIRNASQQKMLHKGPLAFAAEQLLVLGPLCAAVWLPGLAWYFTRQGRRQRALAFIWIGTIAVLVASGNPRSNYSAPAYCVLLAAGGVAIERFAQGRLRALPIALGVLLLVEGALTLPLAVPLLPPERVPGYAALLGVEAPRDQVDDTAALPLHLAQRFGWIELADAVAHAADTLAPAERADAVVLDPELRRGRCGRLLRVGARSPARGERTQQLLAVGPRRAQRQRRHRDRGFRCATRALVHERGAGRGSEMPLVRAAVGRRIGLRGPGPAPAARRVLGRAAPLPVAAIRIRSANEETSRGTRGATLAREPRPGAAGDACRR